MADNTQVDKPIETPEKEQKKAVPSLNQAIAECSAKLVDVPDALDFSVKKTEGGRHFYSFDNVSPEASRARSSIARTLKEVYDNGAYSYGQFSAKLRVPGLSIQAILDEEFIEQNNIQA